MNTKFRQLIGFPGGGVRGCISAVLLDRLESSHSLDLEQVFSFSGTSTGAIIAGALCRPNPFRPADIIDLFKTFAKDIFRRKTWRPELLDLLIFSCPFSIKRLEEIIKHHIGSTVLLGDCPRKIVIVIYDMNGMIQGKNASMPLIIHNHGSTFPAENHMEIPLYRAICGSAAAPTYFEPYQWKNGDREEIWTDGSQTENSSTLSNYLICRDKHTGDKVKRKNISALQIGNGTVYTYENPTRSTGWKTPKRLRGAIGSIVQSGEIYSIRAMEKMLGPAFYNLASPLPKPIDLADYKKIAEMISFAQKVDLKECQKWLQGYFV